MGKMVLEVVSALSLGKFFLKPTESALYPHVAPIDPTYAAIMDYVIKFILFLVTTSIVSVILDGMARIARFLLLGTPNAIVEFTGILDIRFPVSICCLR